MKKSVINLSILTILLVAVYLVVSSRTDTFTGRWLAWKSSDVDDYLRFPKEQIKTNPPTFYFEAEDKVIPFDQISYQYKGKPKTNDLETLLESTSTTAFIVVKDDKIQYEGYFNGTDRESVVTSFSIAKSITSLMVGMAIDDGYIGSLDDSVTTYIPGLLEVDLQYQDITLGHLLSMKSGIAFKDTDIPWHDKSRAYYHPHLRDVVLDLPIANPPGEAFVYNTFNPIILGIVLEEATGQTVTQYFESRFWQRLGMEFDASWSIDSLEDGMAKMESGLNARAIDFAKIGRLMLSGGNWDGDQVISKDWIELSMRIDSENNVAKFGENIYYQIAWWIYGPTETTAYTVSGWGHLGQYLYIFPDEDVIVLRFGKEYGDVDSWYQIALEIVEIVAEGN